MDRFMHANLDNSKPAGKAEQAAEAFARLLADASRRGFYGTAGLTLSIQDGSIQHIRVALEKMIK